MGPGAVPAAPPKRRRLRTVVLVVALAAIVVNGVAFALDKWDELQSTDSGRNSAAQSPTPTNGSDGAVPADWERRHDPVGFSISLPKGWTRTVSIDQDGLRQVDYSPDHGKHLVRVAVDTAPDFSSSYEHMRNLEERVSGLRNYKQLRLKEELFRDLPGSRWEYTWNALAKDAPHYFPGPYHAIDVGYVNKAGTEYAIYEASPAADWAATSKQFDVILRSFQEHTSP